MPAVVRAGDSASGHTDIQGNPVAGTVTSATCAQSVLNGGTKIAIASTIVNFPSHPHAMDGGTPIDYQSHDVAINATGKNKATGAFIAVDGDVVPVADVAGPNATLSATTANLNCKQ